MSGITLAAPSSVEAKGGVSLSQTRVVFLSTDKVQTLTVKNTGKQRYLIQSRVQQAPDDTSPAPFIITPPLFALQPDSRQLLRIMPQGAALPADRESLFYLSVLAIPARGEKEEPVVPVSMGMRFVLKLIYRPVGLKAGLEVTGCSLRLHQDAKGIRIENPTPYFQTLGRLTLNRTPVNLDIQPSMLAPRSAQSYSTQGKVLQAEWQTVTDYGDLSTPCQQTVSSTQEVP
ncbi:molecular chaperone [Serratia fonticola]|uniref:fimbrial biogenesis chaperone n=1 Tax=Serratia fonticola TaxID=47917 RepID=UPI001ED92D21|nr:molecular chaperone [Serratia fonticola]